MTILEKVATTMQNIIWMELWHMPLEASDPCHTVLESSLQQQNFPRKLCVNLESFRSYLTLKLSILEKYSNIHHIWPFGGSDGGYCLVLSTVRKLFLRGNICRADMPMS